MSKKKLVMIGNGMAGVRTIEEILKVNGQLYDITIFGKEPYPNYNRIQLSHVLQGDMTIESIVMNDWDWYSDRGIELYTGEAIRTINTTQKLVYSDNRIVSYDELIIATGSSPFILPIPGADKQGVIGFRDIADCLQMMETSKTAKRAVVIGGGLLGLEAAKGLLSLGMEVDVVHLMDYLMEKQLDEVAARMLQMELESHEMKFHMSKEAVEIVGDERVTSIYFRDGSVLPADLVVMATGIVPNVDLAKASGLQVNRGIVINNFMETSLPHVYAVGECAEHLGTLYGLVAPLYEQAQVLAKKLSGESPDPYVGSIVGAQLKISDVDLFSAREIKESPETRTIKVHDEWNGIYKKVILRDQCITGIVLYGDTSDSNRLFGMMMRKEDVSGKTTISFFNERGGVESFQDVSSMPADEVVCGCNGINKGMIVEAVQSRGLTSVEEIGGCTNAGRSCGRCKPLIQNILEHTLGGSFEPADLKPTLCSCTSWSRDEVVAGIREKGLTSVKEVMLVLGWKNEEGCTKCRPALNYYLGMIYPDYQDDRDSRLVNEKLHANIQKDGTYSVIPRMYGGVTTANDLRKIADVADKYQVPLVKLTGGQRIGLFGLKKEELPQVWSDLEMPSGYAYGKTLRTVKTCVGKTFCRFGTQDSMGLGIELEKRFERLDTPHKVKMGVSGCPRNCTEAGIKDIGFVGVDGGWEIYVAGNGGTDLRAGEFLAKVKTEEEALELTGAYLQYYRETALYLERTSKWMERIDLKQVQEHLADPTTCRELNDRLEQTLARYVDPWGQTLEESSLQDHYYSHRNVNVEVTR
ncbi:nitrite reductase large subunit NirB [Ammoniphilus sp. CFH 90114]|uniref:nitrite reductase large subunit NirB n=1 Tax=Ammoniphilus sp. CFH 90114 TaxID=2493665 RepID=UPI00100E0D26|nr:nitrite reductase large subunit NirB [Ammoniphilus sp. CFH 90114]RXT07259.1 NAD(P)/FAD-dependent oxidoreductase [Ammoniphilus sp. CFH 90114]